MKEIVGFDLDGVLCDFSYSWTQLAHRKFGVDVQSQGAQQSYGYKNLTSKQRSAMWDAIDQSSFFWQSFEPLVTHAEIEDMHTLSGHYDLVYITGRTDKGTVHDQTEHWLRRYGLPSYPILFTQDKVETLIDHARGTGVRAFIDDKPSIIEEMQDARFPIYIRDWPYNRMLTAPKRVGSVGEFVWNILRADA